MINPRQLKLAKEICSRSNIAISCSSNCKFSATDALGETRALIDWVGHCCIEDSIAQKFVQEVTFDVLSPWMRQIDPATLINLLQFGFSSINEQQLMFPH